MRVWLIDRMLQFDLGRSAAVKSTYFSLNIDVGIQMQVQYMCLRCMLIQQAGYFQSVHDTAVNFLLWGRSRSFLQADAAEELFVVLYVCVRRKLRAAAPECKGDFFPQSAHRTWHDVCFQSSRRLMPVIPK